nr:MAG TPA: putative transferase, nesg, ydcK, Structural Genomics.38A [Caudoviricetes sp.]
MKKYELTDEVKVEFGVTLHRIRALVDIERWGVKAGDLGGWVEKESNLDQDHDAWVSGKARVYGKAWVPDDAWVSGKARVYGKARVSGNAQVSGKARVYDDARVSGDARVSKAAHVLTAGPIGSRDDTTTFFRAEFSAGFAISVCCGCFRGTLDEFRAKVKQTHGDNKHGKVYQIAADLAEAQIELEEAQ